MGNLCCYTNAALKDEKEDAEARRDAPLSSAEFVETLTSATKHQQADGKHLLINVEVIETILLAEDEDDDEGEDARPLRRSQGRKGTGFVTKAEVESAAQRVSFTEGGDGQGGALPVVIQPAPKRKGRKPTGMVTKEQLLSALDQAGDDEDSDEESPAPAPANDTSNLTLQDRTQINAGEKLAPEQLQPAPKRKGRKPTGYVSKSKLRRVLDMFGD